MTFEPQAGRPERRADVHGADGRRGHVEDRAAARAGAGAQGACAERSLLQRDRPELGHIRGCLLHVHGKILVSERARNRAAEAQPTRLRGHDAQRVSGAVQARRLVSVDWRAAPEDHRRCQQEGAIPG
jgi:hypothetical protein